MSLFSNAELIEARKIRVLGGVHKGKEGSISRDATNNKKWVFFHSSSGKEERTSINNIELIQCNIDTCSTFSYHSAFESVVTSSYAREALKKGTAIPTMIRCVTPEVEDETSNMNTLKFNTQDIHEIMDGPTGLAIKEIILEKPSSQKKFRLGSLVLGSYPMVFSIELANIQSTIFSFPKSYAKNGKVYTLLTCKMHDDGTLPWGKKYSAKLHYYAVSSGELIQDKLDAIANFSGESPQKAKLRLEILESPGDLPCDGKPLNTDDFEIIDDEDHDGHGYIPRTYLDRFLGVSKPASRVRDIQVRLCGPKIGLFKGNLVEKQGINKIQLRKNMCKVPPSLTCSDDWVRLVITQKYPSVNSWYMGRNLNSHKPDVKPPPKTFCNSVRNGTFVPKPDI